MTAPDLPVGAGSVNYLHAQNLGMISDDELLAIEEDLLRRTFKKGQISSMYSGLSVLMAVMAVFILVSSSQDAVLRETPSVIFIPCMITAMLCGSFVKKRMYRMYQLDRHSLPGLREGSFIGFLGHMAKDIVCRMFGRTSQGASSKRSDVVERDLRAFHDDDDIAELRYGYSVMTVASVVAILLTAADAITDLMAVHYLALIVISMILGFLYRQIAVTTKEYVRYPGRRKQAGWNPLYPIHVIFSILIGFAVVAVYVPMLCSEIHSDVSLAGIVLGSIPDWVVSLGGVFAIVVLALSYYLVLCRFRDYHLVLDRDLGSDGPGYVSVSEIPSVSGRPRTFVYKLGYRTADRPSRIRHGARVIRLWLNCQGVDRRADMLILHASCR